MVTIICQMMQQKIQLAVEILKDTDVEVKPVDSSQFPAKAKRPLNSTMSLAKAKATGFVIPTWQDALKEFYKQEVIYLEGKV